MAADVKIFASQIEDACEHQVREVSSLSCFETSKIRIMPDCHAGKGCVVGFTATVNKTITPNLIGVDIGCGLYTVKLSKNIRSLDKLEDVVRHQVPMGFQTHRSETYDVSKLNLNCYDNLKHVDNLNKSLGTLGGGNHFVELDRDEVGNEYLIIHTGSRNLGKQVCEYYQNLAVKTCPEDISDDLKYLTGENAEKYLEDMMSCQQFAMMNRRKIVQNILAKLDVHAVDNFDTMHNYCSFDKVIRKGAICAKQGKRVLIPFNMKDGCVIAVGKGNEDWNNSAPHGAGRRLSRTKAKQELSLEKFMKDMQGIYSTSVVSKTLDEAPDAYKDADSIINLLDETVQIQTILKPVYNAKAV